MTDIFNIIPLLFFAIFFSRFVWQKNPFSYLTALVWLFYLSSIVLAGIELIPLYKKNMILKSVLLTAEYTYLALMVITCIEKLTAKKMKTLWRLPVIGLLLGMLFQINQTWHVYIVTELVIFAFLYKYKDENRFVFRNHIKSLSFIPLIYFFYMSFNLFPLFFIASWYFKLLNCNAVIVKNNFLEYDKKINEE